MAAVISTPLSAPMIAATRLRGGNAACARGGASIVVGCTGILIVRMDSPTTTRP